ncbi:MAG: oxygen-independent coproporphyrinogen III oxidase [Alphaproteobacteria bacterium]|nr:oxygen-independent coproporphyrinogen III oxidase [Alphaproteobacteria bacterium]
MKLKTNPKTNRREENFDLWLGKPAPRYTSFPPAPFFTPAVTEQDYSSYLSTLADDAGVSLYLHIPFCRSLCLYCGCNMSVTQRADRVQNYLGALKREIERVAALTGKRRVRSLHFGGGTPNILGEQELRDLFAVLRQHFDFNAAREIAMELDPRLASADQAESLAACGITRVSLGAQDFNPEVQLIVRRHQPYEQVAAVCAALRHAGIRRINLDLMYGLPKQTPESLADTARRVCALAPDRVALFSYAHVPQIKKHQRVLEKYGLPDVRQCLALENAARGVLIENGYCEIGIDHFAKEGDGLTQASREGRLHRTFQGYTEDDTPHLLGLGASSIGQTPAGYFQNEPDARAYQSLVANGQLPIRRGFLVSPEDRLRRAIIERLMCDLACDVAAVCRRHNFPIENLAEDFARLRPYEEAGLIARQGATLRLATPYRMAVRIICKAFDPYTLGSQKILSSRVA